MSFLPRRSCGPVLVDLKFAPAPSMGRLILQRGGSQSADARAPATLSVIPAKAGIQEAFVTNIIARSFPRKRESSLTRGVKNGFALAKQKRPVACFERTNAKAQAKAGSRKTRKRFRRESALSCRRLPPIPARSCLELGLTNTIWRTHALIAPLPIEP
jgi:hypothetical protein